MKYFIEKSSANDENAIIQKKNFKNDEIKNKGEILIVVETQKTLIDIVAEENGPVYSNFNEGDKVSLDEVVIYQNEKPKNLNKNLENNENKFTKKALELIKKENLELSIFSNYNLVREVDVKKILQSNKNTENLTNKNQLLDNYIEPPVAYLSFETSFNSENKEAKLWEMFYKAKIWELTSSNILHNLINVEDKLIPIDFNLEDDDFSKSLIKTQFRAYRNEKSNTKVDTLISYLKSNLDFNHVPLLYPNSFMTITVSEILNSNKLKVNFCYDHRYLNSYQILKKIEKSFE